MEAGDTRGNSKRPQGKDLQGFRGKLPYAYQQKEKRHENSKVRIIRVHYEVIIYNLIVSWYVDYKESMQRIATRLDQENVSTRFGKEHWSPAVISQILRHPAYWSGRIAVKSNKAEGGYVYYKCPPLITESRWREIQARIADAKKQSGRPRRGADEFLLYGLLKCGFCGTTLSCKYQKKQRFYFCYWHECSGAAMESHNKERCPLPLIPAEEIERMVYEILMVYICGEAFLPIYLVHPKRIESALDTVKLEGKIKNLQAMITHLNEKRIDAKKVLKKVEEMLNREPHDFSSCANVLDTALAKTEEIDAKLRDTQTKIDRLLKRRAETSLLLEFRQKRRETLVKIHETLLSLPFPKKQKLLAGMLEEKIVIQTPGDDFIDPDRPADNWTEGMDESKVEYYTYPPVEYTWRDAVSPDLRFDPVVLQDVLSEVEL